MSRQETWVTSIGLDVGTSTTKLVVSRLRIAARGSPWAIQEYEIAERILEYESPVFFTPLSGPSMIDTDALCLLLKDELRRAGIHRSHVKSGAVIITGETAAKANAEQLVHLLSEQAGDFVAASAGPDLEGILAGKGSGAAARSLLVPHTVANIDIGGGTANVALFRAGEAIATVTFHIGGRLVEIAADGTVLRLSPSIGGWLKEKGWPLRPGMRVDLPTLLQLADDMARAMFAYLTQGCRDQGAEALCVGELPASFPPVGEVMLSGGVAELLRNPKPRSIAETAVYGDIGPLLAHSLDEECRRHPWLVSKAEQTVRATVIGAGVQSMELSGSTIHSDAGALPVRNVPVVQARYTPGEDPGAGLAAVFESGRRWFGTGAEAPFAVYFAPGPMLSYAELRRLADALAAGFMHSFSPGQTAVVVMENDMAKALGQLLSLRCVGKPKVVCVDRVRLRYGDYIDIGERVEGAAVPVIIKTLMFPAEGEPDNDFTG